MLARFRRLQLETPATVVVGFSGGADSLALATVLGRIGNLAELSPVLVHVDHAWRPESVAEQRRAGELAAALGLPFRGERVPDDPRRLHPNVGAEEAARRERFRLLAVAATAAGTDLVALAHHQDDQAETVLLHLIRGAGSSGVSGMRQVRHLPVPWWQPEEVTPVRLWRPLLDEPRSAVRAYAEETGLAPIADPSNDDPAFRRNLIRHQALPLLERISPGATAALARFAGLAADDEDALLASATAALTKAVTVDGELPREAVLAEPVAVRRRMVRRWVQDWSGLETVTAERTEALLALLEPGERGRLVEVGEGVSVTATALGIRVPRPDAVAEKRSGGRDSDVP